MASASRLKQILERNIEHLRAHPDDGRGTATTVVRLRNGRLACDIEDGHWKLVADEMPGDGGDGLGPDPGVFVRAGLGSCLAMGYAMWAAYLGVPFDAVEVRVDADYDAPAMLGLNDSAPPGWGTVRYAVAVSSSAPEDRVRELIEHSDRYSSVLDVIRRAVPVERTLEIRAGARS